MNVGRGNAFNLRRGICRETRFGIEIEVVADGIGNFEPTKDIFRISGFDG